MQIDGPTLRHIRKMRNMKQSHLAELAGVDQATISRWERRKSLLPEDTKTRLHTIFYRFVTLPEDDAIKRLVTTSSLKVHLICDQTHCLLSASGRRLDEWKTSLPDVIGKSMLPYASQEILDAELALKKSGWTDQLGARTIISTGPNNHPIIHIPQSRAIWERILLSNGMIGRLVTTLEDSEDAQFELSTGKTIPRSRIDFRGSNS
ncbi:helix-turn-helix domain-containing protein [Agrobacterium sp. BT-220-3]|nr:helix-turn-helix domain-containing protein [Agrobacterium sp. BT-220-3]